MTAKSPATENGSNRSPFSVLFVCTANQARSPMALLIMRRVLRELDLNWSLRAAGTHAVRGKSLPQLTCAVLSEIGIDASEFRSRPLTATMVQKADLVLTADTQNRHDVATIEVGALGRGFTLKQFSRYASV